MPKYRLYIDEVGNSDMGASLDENHRYLSLTGVIVSLDYVASALHPRVEELKRRYFGSHPDDPIILHRKDIVNQRGPFHALIDPEMRAAFDADVMALIRELDYVVITAGDRQVGAPPALPPLALRPIPLLPHGDSGTLRALAG